MQKFFGIVMAAAAALTAQNAAADEPIKIGLVLTYSGPYATNGQTADLGVDTFTKV